MVVKARYPLFKKDSIKPLYTKDGILHLDNVHHYSQVNPHGFVRHLSRNGLV